MAGNAVQDHLALMARSGLMTHVAQIEAPVTAEAVARFRAEAAGQATNVMALAAGRFALCLAPGMRGLRSSVPHQLWPIGQESQEDAPPAKPRPAPPPQQAKPEAPAAPSPAGPDPAGEAIAAVAEGQVQFAQMLDTLTARIEAAEARGRAAEASLMQAMGGVSTDLDARLHALTGEMQSRLQAVATQLETAARGAEGGLDRLTATLESALSAQDGRHRARLEALETRLADGQEAARAASDAVWQGIGSALQALEVRAEEEAVRTSEALTALRVNMRALSERVAELPLRLAPDGAVSSAGVQGRPLDAPTPHVTARHIAPQPGTPSAPADITVLHPALADAPHAQREPSLQDTLRAVLDRLDREAGPVRAEPTALHRRPGHEERGRGV
ncbi:MAG: hypothetical protein AAFR47_03415 [Pseudomonadota bacterium]